MRCLKFTESQIESALTENDGGVPIAELLRKHKYRRATFFTRAAYPGT